MSKEMIELAELKDNLATNITLLSHHKAMLLRLVEAALRISAVAEPVAKTDAEHFDDILKTEAARLRAMADRFDPSPAEPAAPVPASVREALEDIDSWRGDTLGKRPHEDTEYRNAAIDEAFDRGVRMAFYRCSDRARIALASLPAPEAAPQQD